MNDEHLRFVSLLALELENGDISLPSLPDVVLKIRKLLENENCNFERVSQAVSVDPVLVSKLFVYANSAYYNRSNIKAETLDAAISRLGFEVVRNTAMSLAMKQLYRTDTSKEVARHVRDVWIRGMQLSCMAYAIARNQTALNHETAYLCGLLHEVGKLYILTKVEDFPDLLGAPEALASVMEEWTPQISKSIVETWGFPPEVVESTDPSMAVDVDEDDDDDEESLLDIMVAAMVLVSGSRDHLGEELSDNESCVRLGINEMSLDGIYARYEEKLDAIQQSLA